MLVLCEIEAAMHWANSNPLSERHFALRVTIEPTWKDEKIFEAHASIMEYPCHFYSAKKDDVDT